MNPEFWTIVSFGIAILITIATTNRALRREMNERFGKMDKRIDGLGERITAVQVDMGERFAAVQADMGERFAAVQVDMGERFAAVQVDIGERFAAVHSEMSERFGRVEGLLEGIGYAQRKRAGKERSDGEPGPALPPS